MLSQIAVVLLLLLPSGAARQDDPETVMITLRPKAGAEAQLRTVISNHWETARRLGLVNAEPHVTLELKDDTRAVYFVDVFTWRDRDIPDNAPQAILTIWNQMNELTAPRSAGPGLDIREATRIDR